MLSANAADLNRPLRRLAPNTQGSLRSANTANIAGSTCTSTRTLTKDRQEYYNSISFAAVFDVLAFVMKAAAVVIAKRRGGPLAMMRHAASSNNSRNPVMENALFLRNLWYFALHGGKLKKGRLSNQRNSRRKDRLWNVQIERTEHMAGRTEKSGEQRVGQNLMALGE